jgi:hypothetical protein
MCASHPVEFKESSMGRCLAWLVLAVVLSPVALHAEIPPSPDEVSTAYDAALKGFLEGEDRQQSIARLNTVIEKGLDSPYYALAQEFLTDLSNSKAAPEDGPPAARLAQTQVEYSQLDMAENWESVLQAARKRDSKDPALQLLAEDRSVIESLLPLLSDRSITHARRGQLVSGFPPPQPRVCDVALAIIEIHAQCRFFHDCYHGTTFHQLPADDRKEVIEHVTRWWKDNKDKSLLAGMRAQLPHVDQYPNKIWMAKTLVRLSHEQKTDDAEYGLSVLRTMVRDARRSFVGAYAADALAELGDTSAVDVFYEEWKSEPKIMHDSHIAFYLCRHGQRREWELLREICAKEFAAGEKAGQAVWPCVLNSGAAVKSNPYAIPILGLALLHTEEAANPDSFSYADQAAEYLQTQLGQDFGYDRGAAGPQRKKAIGELRRWWQAEGQEIYSFDYIEENLIPAYRARPK